MKKSIEFIFLLVALGAAVSCNDYMEPLPDGTYTDKNYKNYPDLIRGLVYKLYELQPTGYNDMEFLGMDAAADNCVFRDKTAGLYLFATGSPDMLDYPYSRIYSRDQAAIMYANMYLKDNLGLNTRMLIGEESDLKLRRTLQGDAYGMRAWYLADLLTKFGGVGLNGELLGVPFYDHPLSAAEYEAENLHVKRLSYDKTVEQIIRDCDSALVYLPLSNRDFTIEGEEKYPVTGAVRYGMIDQVSVWCLKALTYLTWASPAFNPQNDMSRWEHAAYWAKKVIDYKLEVEGKQKRGFDPLAKFSWCTPNAPEAIMVSRMVKGETMETTLYPRRFNGRAEFGPTQELVDAFPMANGYPITDPRSGYDPQNPYENRDPRFYATIFYNGSSVKTSLNAKPAYTFDTTVGGDDATGGVYTTPTGYYIKKFIYLAWNRNDAYVQTSQKTIFFYRWTHMCLAFAEAANHVVGPTDDTRFGMSAKQAIAYLRTRNTEDNLEGIGYYGDPYLDECAQNHDLFDALVKNEWRIETCFEGRRFHDIRRWAKSVDEVNRPVHGMKIEKQEDGSLKYTVYEVEDRIYPSLWMPLPFDEVLMTKKSIVQNDGYPNWK